MTRTLPKACATACIALAITALPAVATAAPIEPPASAQPVIGGAPTPPFDPICPLCFIREAIESLSAS
ncbi:hypothetical protein ACIA5E_09690 [Nocardia asteroides]|uniref:hypothetical protein n=1 Tax=Nocardia asteroides TaxID=1824 RepID=UPI0037ADD1AA